MDRSHIAVQLHCQNLPGSRFEDKTGIRLGIQKGDVVIEDVAGDTPSVTFTAMLKVSAHPATGKLNFTGPFAHGTSGERFLYLCWGERNNGIWKGFRRAKIPLQPITREAVDNAIAKGQPIKAVIDMTDKNGGPLCASVKDEKIHWDL